MPNYSNQQLMGHLGKDAETRSVGDKNVTSWSMAVTRKRKGREDIVTWFRCEMWGERGAKLVQYLKNGVPIYASGELYQETYQAQDGATRTALKIEVRDVVLLGNRQEGEEQRKAAPAPDGANIDGEPPF